MSLQHVTGGSVSHICDTETCPICEISKLISPFIVDTYETPLVTIDASSDIDISDVSGCSDMTLNLFERLCFIAHHYPALFSALVVSSARSEMPAEVMIDLENCLNEAIRFHENESGESQ